MTNGQSIVISSAALLLRKDVVMKSIGRFVLAAYCAILSVSSLFAQASYRVVDVQEGGTIQGVVRLSGERSQTERMEITKDEKVCGTRKPSPRLTLGKNRGVRNGVVYLNDVARGKPMPRAGTLTLDQRACEYVPHVLIAPIGTQLEIVNSDPVLHNVHTYLVGQAGMKSMFNIAQPVRGQRTAIPQTKLTIPGWYVATCDAGHPWMSASIIVSEHPYYTLTDIDGNFALKDVPPGEYDMTFWHEGVIVIGKELERGKVTKYRFEEPYSVTKKVMVAAGEILTVNFELALRDRAM